MKEKILIGMLTLITGLLLTVASLLTAAVISGLF